MQGAVKVGGTMVGLSPGRQLEMVYWSWREVCGMRGVAVRCLDIAKHSHWEGGIPDPS